MHSGPSQLSRTRIKGRLAGMVCMAPKHNSKQPTFTLDLPDTVRVAGETVSGLVELNVARAQDDGVESLRVNLRGSIITKIVESNSDGSDTKHERTIELIDSGKSLWERGTAFPNPGTHVLVLPFQFKLPDDLPPSFHLSVLHHEATISYTIEVVGGRPGLLRRDRQIRKVFTVLPAASPEQILAKAMLKQGWGGPWRTVSAEQKMRPGIWGDYSHARAQVKIPNLASFPRATTVPLVFFVETRTKTMSRTDAPLDKHNKPLFPAPPSQSADVKLFFHREANIRTQRRNGMGNDCFPHGGLGEPDSTSVKSTIEQAEWIPDAEATDRGVWKRSVQFETTVTLPFAPSFSTETIDCQYYLRFNVSFSGIKNDFKLRVPIQLDPAETYNYADVYPEGPPPPLLDLPPSYCVDSA